MNMPPLFKVSYFILCSKEADFGTDYREECELGVCIPPTDTRESNPAFELLARSCVQIWRQDVEDEKCDYLENR